MTSGETRAAIANADAPAPTSASTYGLTFVEVATIGDSTIYRAEIPAELIEEVRPNIRVATPAYRRGNTIRVETSPGMKLGQRVRHGKFGEGVVLNYEGSGSHARVQVNFADAGTKWLVMSYANLELM